MKVEVMVVESFLGVVLTLAESVGSVCWEVTTFWVKVSLTPEPLFKRPNAAGCL